MTPSSLVELNKLSKQDDLWVLGQPTDFNHPGEKASELFLKRVVSEARDLSSQSIELETCYPGWDWVAEYHLSYRRTNLLRGLDLSKAKTALEIGCGCGAITRYLGEQGKFVDAIEGSQRRADIARLRCRDLNNVRVINANYNDLKLPEAAYDAIFLVGTIKYASKFLFGNNNNEVAVVTLLKKLQRALTPNGVLVITIENRNGLKYWLGATEDYYGQPYVGLTNYWGQSGTKTYTYKEWQILLKQAGIAHWQFQFPFPDYKLPQVILDENFIDTDENAYSLLYRITSRDYLRHWQPGVNEFAIWRALHQAGRLKQFANSFLIIAGQELDTINSLRASDFAYLSGGSRKPEFRTITLKERNRDRIRKEQLWVDAADLSDDLNHQVSQSPYVRGTLLSSIWLEVLLASDRSQFAGLLDQYYKFIKQQLAESSGNSLLDALPANIVVDSVGHYHVIDQEWQSGNSITPEYILFRALLWFGHDNQGPIEQFLESNSLHCLEDFVKFGFKTLSISPTPLLDKFIAHEETLQYKVSEQKNLRPIHQLITTPLIFASTTQMSSMRLYWAGAKQSFSEVQSCQVNYNFTNGKASVRCRFVVDRPVTRIRVTPLNLSSENKLLFFEKAILSLINIDESDSKTVWETLSASDFSSRVQWNQYAVPFIEPKGAFILNGSNAALDFQINHSDPVCETDCEMYEFKLVLAGEASLGPSFINEHFNKVEQTHKAIADQKNLAVELSKKNDENLHLTAQLMDANQRAQLNQAKVSAVTSELKAMRQFISQISQIKLIRSLGRIMPGKYDWITSGFNQYSRFHLNQADYELVRNSSLFDEAFYLENEQDLALFNNDPLRHYLLWGGYNGLNPNRLFDTSFYLKQCPELAAKKTNPLVHYLTTGAAEGKNPCYLFDTDYYLDQHPAIREHGENPLIHYLKTGGREGLDPHPAFDTHCYISQRPDAKRSQLTPLEHFFTYGEPDQISPTAFFDWGFYLEKRPGLQDNPTSAFQHYLEHGYKDGGDPSPFFDAQYYFSTDLKDQKYRLNPVLHYIVQGQHEERSPNPFFDPRFYTNQQGYAANPKFKDYLSEYLVHGEKNGLDPHPLFDTSFYRRELGKIDVYPDHTYQYFMKKRHESVCMVHPLFDPGFCSAQLPHDGREVHVRLSAHYGSTCSSITFQPHPLFDAGYYCSQLGFEGFERINPLIHYITEGFQQGLSIHPEFDQNYYCTQEIEPSLNEGQNPILHFIYHGAQTGQWPSHEIAQLAFKPQLSLVLLVNGPDFRYLSGRIVALMSQLYPCWRAIVMVRNPDSSHDYRYAKALAEDDQRILWLETNGSEPASALLNQILEKSTDEWVVFLNEHHFLQAHALLAFVRRLNVDQKIPLIHSGRNQNDPEYTSIDQPGPGSDGQSSRFFIGPLACFRRSIIDQIGGFATWHQSPYEDRFLTHYLQQVPINRIAYISEPLHYTMTKDNLHIVVRP